MPFVLLIFGAAFAISGYHGNAKKLFALLGSEFSGTPSFGKWAIAILAIGATGYIKPLKTISDSFVVLIVVVLFLSDKGFFSSFSQQFGLSGVVASSQTPSPKLDLLQTTNPIVPTLQYDTVN